MMEPCGSTKNLDGGGCRGSDSGGGVQIQFRDDGMTQVDLSGKLSEHVWSDGVVPERLRLLNRHSVC